MNKYSNANDVEKTMLSIQLLRDVAIGIQDQIRLEDNSGDIVDLAFDSSMLFLAAKIAERAIPREFWNELYIEK